MTDIQRPVQFQLESLEDLVRWMISSSENQHGTIFYSKQNNEHIYSAYINFPNYYELHGLPVHCFAISDKEPTNAFLRYDISDSVDRNKRLVFVDGFDESHSSLGYIQYFPIIKFKINDIPDMFKISE